MTIANYTYSFSISVPLSVLEPQIPNEMTTTEALLYNVFPTHYFPSIFNLFLP